VAPASLPIKINMVVQRGVNDGEVMAMAAWARERHLTLRLSNSWTSEITMAGLATWCAAREIVAQLSAQWPLEPAGPPIVARWPPLSLSGWRGEIGLISSVTEPFCRDCHRARLAADGKLYTCLFSSSGWTF